MNKGAELAKNTVIISIGKICTQFMSFFLLPLYTALLSTEEYGTVDLFGTYSSLLLPVVLLQIDQAVFRYMIDYREKKDGLSRIVTTCILFVVFQCLIFFVFFAVVWPFIKLQSKEYFVFYVLASAWSTMMLQIARGFGNNFIYSIGSFLSAAVQILCNVLFLVVLNMGMNGMLLAIICGNMACALFIIMSTKLWRYIRFYRFNKDILVILLKYSIPLIPNALCWWAINASDRLIVSSILGVGSNGLCAIGHKFAFVVITFYNIFNISWTESASVHFSDEDSEIFFKSTIDRMFKAFSCLCLGIIAFMPFVFNILVNASYSEAYGLIPVYMLASLFNVIVGLYSVIYVALKKTKEIAQTSFWSGVINIITHLLMIRFIGIYAAPLSSAIAFGIMAIYRYFDVQKYIKVRLSKEYVLGFVAVFGITCIGYYSNNLILILLCCAIAVLFTFFNNKSLILELIKALSGYINQKK